MKSKIGINVKVNTYEKVIRAIWYILLGMGILMVIVVSTFIGLNILGKLPLNHLGIEFTTPGVKINVDSKLLMDFSTPTFISMGINIFMTWLLLLYSVRQFLKIFKSFADYNTPFITDNVHRLKYISYSFFLYSAIIFVSGEVLKLLFQQELLLAGIDNIKLSINASIPFWPIICGIFIIGIAEIFNYGLKLQQDNDSIV